MANETLIEVKNLKKIYKSRKAGNVVALNDVSFALPDKGMVFFLGKSGCGKSTLLNVLGGLDSFDGGEIIVGGRSIKNFTSKESDTYRNEYIGFVFQENNLLDGYTVAQNIGFALDIKKQSGYDDKVNSVLESVDLKDFADRKPNSLSGGQKQRVAIARALVKEPEIILADEPTGALDSETGEEVFNLLKEISTQKLIIVVSHDRLSAQKFGDRIIELKDGKIILDSSPLNKSVESSAQSLKLNAVKSGLPAKRVFSLGAGFLVAKPIRFAFCALICLIAFCCLGVSDAFSCYNKSDALFQTMKLYSTPYISYVKEKRQLYSNAAILGANYDDYVRCKSEVNSSRLDIIYSYYYSVNCENVDFSEEVDVSVKQEFGFKGFAEIDENLARDYGYTLYGKYPTASDEAVITKYLFNAYKKYGYKEYRGNGRKSINSYDDLIGQEICIDYNTRFKVSGILDTKFDEEYYGDYVYNNSDENVGSNGDINGKMFVLIEYGMHNVLYLAPGYYENEIVAKGEQESDGQDIRVMCCPFKGDASLDNIRFGEEHFAVDDEDLYPHGEWYDVYEILNDATRVVDGIDGNMSFVKILFFWISIGTIILSALFVLYYSSGVVSEKKKDLGVLRALGASRADVIKIFLAENGIFVVSLVLLATIFSAVGVVIVNANLAATLGVSAVLVSYTIRQFAILAAIAVGAVVVGIIIPLIKLLCAKPVDLIAGRK